MAHIKVNHSKFESAARTIDGYISSHKKKMKQIDQSVVSLGTSWQGTDYNQMKIEWGQINASGSTSDNMLKSLQNYADALRNAGEKYKQAQARAINRANTLCK